MAKKPMTKQALLVQTLFVLLSTIFSLWHCPAWSQMSTLRDPLVPGTISAPPLMPAANGPLPAPGSGFTPAPVNPGMSGSPTLLPWVPAVPFNNIDLGTSSISLPGGPSTTSQAGTLGPSLTSAIPPSPSTPGVDPGILPGTLWGFKPPALITNVQASGGLTGSAPIHKWGGQQSHDFGLIRTGGSQTVDFGLPLPNVAAVQFNVSEDGPRLISGNGAPAQANLAGAQQTQALYGIRTFSEKNQFPVATFAPF